MGGMQWTKISMYDGEQVVWISGIYKIVFYGDPDTYLAYCVADGAKNWGDHVCDPPAMNFRNWKCWPSLESAQQSCDEHSRSHTPKAATVRVARERMEEMIAEAAHGMLSI